MREAVIVSTARTPIGKAYRGAFNDTTAPTLAGHAIAAAVERAGIDGAEVEDVVIGAALQQGSTHMNIARTSLLRAGLPVSVPGQSMDRQADYRRWYDDCHWRWRGADIAGAKRAYERLSLARSVAVGASARHLYEHDRNSGDRFGAL